MTTNSTFDRRGLPRLPIASWTSGTLQCLSNSWTARVVDANSCGLGLLAPFDRDVGDPATYGDWRFTLGTSEPLRVRIARTQPQRDETFVGVTFYDNVQTTLGDLTFSTTENDWDRLSIREDVEAILADLKNLGAALRITCSQGTRRFRAQISSVTNESRLLLVHDPNDRRSIAWKLGPISISFDLYESCYVAHSEVLRIAGHIAHLRGPKDFVRLLRRKTFRIPSKDGIQALFSARLGSRTHRLPVIEVAENGVLLLDASLECVDPIFGVLPDFQLTFDTTSIAAKATIRMVRKCEKGNLLGVAIDITDVSWRRSWHNLVLSLRYPGLDFRYSSIDHGRIWSLFQRSHYVGHLGSTEAKEQLAEQRHATRVTWDRLEASGVRYARRLMFRRDDEIAAHLQMDRYYDDTWCVHHLAIDGTVSKVLAKELYSAVTDILSAEDALYLITYHRPDLAWNERNYYEFIRRYPFPGHHEVTRFHLYDVDFSSLTSPVAQQGITIRVANKYDLRRIQRFFQLTTGPLERAALAMEGSECCLRGINSEIGVHGLERGRDFLVAMRGKDLVAIAQVEWGSPGVNVFRLFDAIFVYDVAVDGTSVRPELLHAAFQQLKSHGRTHALLFLRDGQVPAPVPEGLHYLCDEVRWIANCVATRRYQAYTQMLFGRLLSRRRTRHPT